VAIITLRNATGGPLRGTYPQGGEYDLPPNTRATFAWVVTDEKQDPVSRRSSEQFPARVEHLLSLGCVEEALADGAPKEMPQELPLHETVDEDEPPVDDPKSELQDAYDADEDD